MADTEYFIKRNDQKRMSSVIFSLIHSSKSKKKLEVGAMNSTIKEKSSFANKRDLINGYKFNIKFKQKSS